jgi:hypothetical protein
MSAGSPIATAVSTGSAPAATGSETGRSRRRSSTIGSAASSIVRHITSLGLGGGSESDARARAESRVDEPVDEDATLPWPVNVSTLRFSLFFIISTYP